MCWSTSWSVTALLLRRGMWSDQDEGINEVNKRYGCSGGFEVHTNVLKLKGRGRKWHMSSQISLAWRHIIWSIHTTISRQDYFQTMISLYLTPVSHYRWKPEKRADSKQNISIHAPAFTALQLPTLPASNLRLFACVCERVSSHGCDVSEEPAASLSAHRSHDQTLAQFPPCLIRRKNHFYISQILKN